MCDLIRAVVSGRAVSKLRRCHATLMDSKGAAGRALTLHYRYSPFPRSACWNTAAVQPLCLWRHSVRPHLRDRGGDREFPLHCDGDLLEPLAAIVVRRLDHDVADRAIRRTGHLEPDARLDARRLNSVDGGPGSYQRRFQHHHTNEKLRPRQLGEASQGAPFTRGARCPRRTTVPHINSNGLAALFRRPRFPLRAQFRMSSAIVALFGWSWQQRVQRGIYSIRPN